MGTDTEPAGDADRGACHNCGMSPVGRYCSACGQKHRAARVSSWTLLGEALSETFSIDSRIGRTVVPFLFRPGLLAVEYNAGRRVHYSAPLRLLLLGIVLFLSTTLVSIAANESGVATPTVQQEDPAFRVDLTDLLSGEVAALSPDDDGLRARIVRHVDGRFQELAGLPPREASRRIRDALIDQLPKVAFFIIPFIAALLKLLYVRRETFFVEHLVFATHYVAFSLTVFAVQSLLPLPGIAFIALVVYLVAGIGRVFEQGWGGTLLKSSVMFAAMVTAVTLLSGVAILLGVLIG
ncbi:MAG: DUF3667 domain-containing protein [Deltaproteobacteria bacterium]|nr:DUF3667 domain-containing protein [Deltaproteobacteria bacterium]